MLKRVWAWLGTHGNEVGIHAMGHLAAAGVLATLTAVWAALHWAAPTLRVVASDWRIGVGLGLSAGLSAATWAVRIWRDRRATGPIERAILRGAVDRSSLLLDLRDPVHRRLEVGLGPTYTETDSKGRLGLRVFDRLLKRGLIARVAGDEEIEFYVPTPAGKRVQALLLRTPTDGEREEMEKRLLRAMAQDQPCLVRPPRGYHHGAVRLNGVELGADSTDPDARTWWYEVARGMIDRGLACVVGRRFCWTEIAPTPYGCGFEGSLMGLAA